MSKDIESVSVVKFVLVALLAALALNFVFRITLKFEGMPVTMGIAGGVAALIAMWFANSIKRTPTYQELSLFLWLYGGTIALACIGLVVFVSMKAPLNLPSLLIITIHALAYPFFAMLFMSEKYMASYLRK